MAIISNILSIVLQQNAKNLALANMTVSDGVESIAQGGGSRLGPLLNPPLGPIPLRQS